MQNKDLFCRIDGVNIVKKITTIILSILLIASLFISCDNATNAVKDELVEVTFSTQPDERSLSVSNPLEDLSEVQWTYIARKTSENQFNFGESPKDENGIYQEQSITLYPTGSQTKTILTLSQGKWKFELFGKKDGKLLYYGETPEVLILRSIGLNQITVEVSPYTSEKGTLSLRDVVISLSTPFVTEEGEQQTTVAPNYLRVDNTEYRDFTGTKSIPDLPAGQYTVTVSFISVEDGLTYATETVVATVYSGRTTIISGNVSEETGSAIIQGEDKISDTSAIVTGNIESDKEVVIISSVVPVASEADSSVITKVTFPEGSFSSVNKTAELSVSVNGVDSNFTVTIPEGEEEATTPIASIDLSVKVDGTKVSSFNDKSVTVETYVLKNLNNVKVSYDGEIVPGSVYDSATGKLTFNTTHFSQYDVLSDAVCYNVNSNNGYEDFADALNGMANGDCIKLIADIDLRNQTFSEEYLTYYFVGTLDGNNHKIYTPNSSESNLSTIAYWCGNSCFKDFEIVASNGNLVTIIIDQFDVQNLEFINVDYSSIDDYYYGLAHNMSLYFSYNYDNKYYNFTGKYKVKDCDVHMNLKGADSANSAVFVGAYAYFKYDDTSTITVEDCTYEGTFRGNYVSLILGNGQNYDPGTTVREHLIISGLKNKGTLIGLNGAYAVGAQNHSGECSSKDTTVYYDEVQAKTGGTYIIENKSGLSCTINEDGSINISATDALKALVDRYEVFLYAFRDIYDSEGIRYASNYNYGITFPVVEGENTVFKYQFVDKHTALDDGIISESDLGDSWVDVNTDTSGNGKYQIVNKGETSYYVFSFDQNTSRDSYTIALQSPTIELRAYDSNGVLISVNTKKN